MTVKGLTDQQTFGSATVLHIYCAAAAEGHELIKSNELTEDDDLVEMTASSTQYFSDLMAATYIFLLEWQRFHVNFYPCSQRLDGFCRFITDICNICDFKAVRSGSSHV
ncbi:conserved hypothetical protein [Trichinella spiralis]|uniref:hypothetical protein n=1 Tax=Trichinella spiralis TaxID=6334 RepID=UPI0001EFE4FA|nr:conserved hypothetical protein [Trichinella spiralis]